MKEYNCLQAIVMAFYSRDLYRDVAKNWGAGVIFYLLLLLTISWGIIMIQLQPAISAGFKEFATEFSEQLPHTIIEKGQVKTPENIPYYIKEPDTKEVAAIIDTSGKYKTLDDVPQGTKALLTKDRIMYIDDKNTIKIHQLPESLNFDFKPKEMKELLIKFVGWSWIVLLPICIFFSFIYRFIQVVIYAVIGKIFAALSDVPLSYGTILKLTIVAITPALVIGTILDFLHISFPFEWLIYFVISMGYLIFAIRANKET